MARKVRPQNTLNQQVDDNDDSSSSSAVERYRSLRSISFATESSSCSFQCGCSSTVKDSSEHYSTRQPKEYVINPYGVFPLPPKIVPVRFNSDEINQQFLKDSLEKLDIPKYEVPQAGFVSFFGSKQLKPQVVEVDPITSMEDKNNSNLKEDHQGVKLQDVGDELETKNGNQLNVEDETKVKKTISELVEIKKIEEKTNLDIMLHEKRHDSSYESSAPINNQEALGEEITKHKPDNSIDQTPSTSTPKEEEVKVIQETINPQLTDNSKKNNNKESEFLTTLNPRILATPLPTQVGTKPKAELGTSSDRNNILDIKNKPEFDTTKKEIPSTQDILAMCTPMTGAVPKQPKNTGSEKENDRCNKKSKNEKSTQADSKQITSSEITNSNKQSNGTNVGIDHTSVINTICQAFEEARMLQDFSNQTTITAPSNGKVQPHVKAVDPRVNRDVKTINPQLTANPKRNNNKESGFWSTLNPEILVTPLPVISTKPKPNLGTSSDKNKTLEIKNTPELNTTKKEIMSTQDILEMCTPKIRAVPKQSEKTGCGNGKPNKKSKNESSQTTNSNKVSNETNVGIDYTPVIDVICKTFEGFKMIQTSSNRTTITVASNDKVKPQVKTADPRVNKGTKTAPKQFEEKYLLRDVTQKNKESKTSVVKPTDFKVIDEKEKYRQTPNQRKASKATNKNDKVKGNNTSGEATERKTKKEKVNDCGYLPPLRVTVPATTYVQLRRRLDEEPLYQVRVGHVMINIYSEEELANIAQYYDEYLDELLPKKKFNDSRDE